MATRESHRHRDRRPAGRKVRVRFAERPRFNRGIEVAFNRKMRAVAAQAHRDAMRDNAAALRETLDFLADGTAADVPVASAATALATLFRPKLGEAMVTALMSCHLLARMATELALGQYAKAPMVDASFAELSDVPPEYRAAVEWMQSRGILSRDELDVLVQALSRTSGITPSLVEHELRQRFLAIAGASEPVAIASFQRAVTNAVARGQTFQQFRDATINLLDRGDFVGGVDGYLENVFRTETSAAYTEQREETLRDPEVDDFVWGIEIYNPSDDRSRDTHSAVDGLLVQKGSAAWDVLHEAGLPPFSYQCRCSMAPVIVGDPENAGIEEPANALELVLAIERFG